MNMPVRSIRLMTAVRQLGHNMTNTEILKHVTNNSWSDAKTQHLLKD